MPRYLFILLLLCPFAALGEEVDLLQALGEASRSRPSVLAAEAEAEAAHQGAGEAKSRYFPRLTLSETFLATDEPGGSLFISLNQEDLKLSSTADPYNFPPSRKDFATRLTLDQPLWDPDIAYGEKRARKGAEAACKGAAWSAEGAAFETFRAYLGVQRAEAAGEWAASSRRLAEELLRLARERKKAGVGLKADELRAQVSLSEAQRRELRAQNDLLLARKRLALSMGRESGEVDIAAPLAADLFAVHSEPQAKERADLTALSLMAEEAALSRKQSTAAYQPRLGLSASYTLHDASTPFGDDAASWSVQAGMQWELFDGLRRSKAKGRALSKERAAKERLREASRQAELGVEEATLRAEEARRMLESSRTAVEAAEEGYRLIFQRYESGLADLSEVMATRSALDGARFELVAAETGLIESLGAVRFQEGAFLKTFFPVEGGDK